MAATVRLISLDNIRDASKERLCKEYVEESITKDHQKTIDIIVEYLHKHKIVRLSDKEGLLSSLTTSVNHNSDRQTKSILDNIQVHKDAKTLCILSNPKFYCTNGHTNNVYRHPALTITRNEDQSQSHTSRVYEWWRRYNCGHCCYFARPT